VNWFVMSDRVEVNSMVPVLIRGAAGSRPSWLIAEVGQRVTRYWKRLPEPQALE
jgi:hypothetical protein